MKKIVLIGLMTMIGRCEIQADLHPALKEIETILNDKSIPATSAMLAACLIEIAANDPYNQEGLFGPVIKMFITHGCDINETFYLKDYPAYEDMSDDNFWNRPVTPLILFALGFDMIDSVSVDPVSNAAVDALISNGAKIIVGDISALNIWAEWYDVRIKHVSSKEVKKFFIGTLKTMFDAADKLAQNNFLEKYPEHKIIVGRGHC